MKSKAISIISLLFLFQISCAENRRTISSVVIMYDYGDFSGRIYIANSEGNIDAAFNSDTSIGSKSFLRTVNRYIVDSEVLSYISSYVISNCASYNENFIGNRTFTIQLYEESNKIKECYLSDEEKINKYFSELIHEIEVSSNSESNKKIIKVLEAHIK